MLAQEIDQPRGRLIGESKDHSMIDLPLRCIASNPSEDRKGLRQQSDRSQGDRPTQHSTALALFAVAKRTRCRFTWLSKPRARSTNGCFRHQLLVELM